MPTSTNFVTTCLTQPLPPHPTADENDPDEVTNAARGLGNVTTSKGPLYILAGMPLQLNRLDVEGTLRHLNREPWPAKVVKKLGGKSAPPG